METATAQPTTRRHDPRMLQAPANFPVRWQQPDDAKMYWELDLMHYPAPMAPLEFTLMLLYSHGFNTAAEQFELPVRMRNLHINTYSYQSIYPIALPPEGVLKMLNGIGKVFPGFTASIQKKAVDGQARKYLAKMMPFVDRLMELWNNDWLPEIREHLAFWDRFDLRSATTDGLLKHFEESVQRSLRIGDIHFFIGIPQLYAISRYQDIYTDLFPGDHPLEAFTLLQGFDNKTLETDRELWRLSLTAANAPAVRDAIVQSDPGSVLLRLKELPEAGAFLAALETYLSEYGQRGDRFATIGEVSWIENPAPVLKNLRDYLINPVPDPAEERIAHERARTEAVAAARARLKGYPKPVVEQFENALRAAQEGTILQEDHGFWIDYRCLYCLRRVVLEFGRRFAASGVCERNDDPFFLTIDELRETAEKLPVIDRRELIARRRAEMQRFASIRPPRAVGRLPLMPPPEADPVARTIVRFFGPSSAEQKDTSYIRGTAGSTGVYRGTARVIRNLADASRLAPGEILVTETTAAPWTPLFATAGAVVTNTGGVLSHCALVAREYRIPAVVGTVSATERIADGAQIEVDGNTGRVTLL
ncbi:MAG: hypothetical protein JST22_05840 [Bacteroidetes bacterium]|nr:hypothetical protein [Bacteroidota bacterium]